MSNSWYVEFLLRNYEHIKHKIVTVDPDSYFEVAYTMDLEDDLYNDLLLIETVVVDMFKSGRATPKQKKIISQICKGRNFVDMEGTLGISRITTSKIFSEFCDGVGYMLGGIFTNEGFMEYMIDKYSLNTEQVAKMQNFLESNVRHTRGG